MNIHIRQILAAALLAAATWTQAPAMPAYPKPITVVQPDGRTITILQRGDERIHWAETTDGYTLLRDKQGYWAFARTDAKGNLSASDLRYEGSSLQAKAAGIKPGLRYSSLQCQSMIKAATPQTDLMVDGTFPSTGKRKLLVLLVNYSDTKTTYTPADFRRMMNEEGYGGIGSFRDFYKEQSYGKLDIDVTVTDWITLPLTKATYGADGAAYMIYDALSLVCDTLDLKQYDNDGDGILDGLAVIHQGTGQEMSANTDDIWSHSAIVYGQTFNGVTLRRYTIEPEKLALNNRMSTIGVICHEFGHALGAPDFYDTDYAKSGGEFCGTGKWDLLASGAWLGDYGDRPAGINGWQKWVYGWSEPVILDNDTVITDMPAADQQPVAYRFETGTPGEYYFMENRQQTGTFDASIPGHGLIVYHVNENIISSNLIDNTINSTYPQGIYTVCSDAGVDPDNSPSSFGDVNSAAAPFPGTYSHTEFSDNSLPSTLSLDGRFAYRALKDISESNGKISFHFEHGDEPAKPESLTAATKDGNVVLTWKAPSTQESVDHYTIYRGSEKIATTTSTTYTDEAPDGGTVLTYQVDATYASQLISHPVSAKIMVPANKVKTLTASISGSDINLAWTTENTLKWCNLNDGQLQTTDYDASTLEYANRFTAADLATYVGGKITHMGFFPMLGPSEMTVKFRIYEGDKNGGTPTLVSERNVKEFAKEQPRELKLTQPVTIKAGKDYWLAVYCESNKGYVTVACDQNTVIDGRGNCGIIDGEFVTDPSAYGNFYITATVTPVNTGSRITSDDSQETYDPACDFYYPKGFAVYFDGKLVGRTTARTYTHSTHEMGTHTLTVASLFPGGNVSKGVSQNVTVSTTGITDTDAATATVSGGKGEIAVYGYEGAVSVADLSGRTVSHTVSAAGHTVSVQPGIYIVTLAKGHRSYKVAVQ